TPRRSDSTAVKSTTFTESAPSNPGAACGWPPGARTDRLWSLRPSCASTRPWSSRTTERAASCRKSSGSSSPRAKRRADHKNRSIPASGGRVDLPAGMERSGPPDSPVVRSFSGLTCAIHAALSFLAFVSPFGPQPEACMRGDASGSPPVVQAAELRYTYPGSAAPAVDGVSLSLAAGERLALIGPSGSGKSTLGCLVAGLLKPDSGSIEIPGGAVRGTALEGRRPAAMVFQNPETQLIGSTV